MAKDSTEVGLLKKSYKNIALVPIYTLFLAFLKLKFNVFKICKLLSLDMI
jgi:hypothetical protein